MTRIGSLPANNAVLNAANNTTQKPQQQEKYIEITLEFTAEELKVKRDKSMPDTVQLSEKRVEDRLFKRFNFDARNSMDMELMKLRLNTNETPHEAIDWELNGKSISTFPATRTANGNYQVKLSLSQKTAEQLRGQSFPTAPNAKPLNPNETLAARNGANVSAQRANIENKLGKTSLEGLTPEEKELMLDLLDVGLSVAGIFDPTPISDGAGAGLSLSRGDYWGAGISVIGMIPYLGDLAKLGKLPKLVKIVENTVNVAKNSTRFAKAVEGLLSTLKGVLGKVPLDKLPAPLQSAVKSMKNKIDEFFASTKKAARGGPPEPPQIKKVKVDGVDLPATTKESVDNKLWTYLLDPSHPQGGPKAKWFKEALGFSRENMDDLAKQIVFDPAKAVKTADTQHGVKYNQVIGIVGENGRKIDVTFGWIKNNDGVVRLTTAIPTKK